MEKLTSIIAYWLLTKDVIKSPEDSEKPENRWVNHCLYVGAAAERIANKMNLDKDYAKALGYVHDIGRKISHSKHVLEGYKYMAEEGYKKEANICLTHSFIDNDIEAVAGGRIKNPDYYKFLSKYLKAHECTIYDNIIQLCDLFCLETGFTTIEKRMIDISKRKGIHENSKYHWEKTLELKNKIEILMNCDLYSLFPELSEDLENVEEDREYLENLLNQKSYKI